MSNEDDTKQKKCKDLIEKTLKRKLEEKLHLQDYDKEISSDVYTSGEINFRLYCHLVGYGDQVQNIIGYDKLS